MSRTEPETMLTFAALQAAMMLCFGMVPANFALITIAPPGHLAGTGSSIFGTLSIVMVTEREVLFGGNRAAIAEP